MLKIFNKKNKENIEIQQNLNNEINDLINKSTFKEMNTSEKVIALENFTNNDDLNKFLFYFFGLYISFFLLAIYVTFFNEKAEWFLKITINTFFVFSVISMFFHIKAINFLKAKKEEIIKSNNFVIEHVYPNYLKNKEKIKKDLSNNLWLFIGACSLTYFALFYHFSMV